MTGMRDELSAKTERRRTKVASNIRPMDRSTTKNKRDAKLRVGLIGYGLAGKVFHAPLITVTEGLRLDTIVTANPERQRQALADYPGVQVVDAADYLWTRASELDLVVVATPNRTHVPLAKSALEAGLPVVVDKPFAPTVAEGRLVLEEARRRRLLLTVFQNRRWDGDFLTLRRLLDRAAVGQPHRFESRFERWRPTPKGGWRERGAPEEAGGILYDLGSHLIDQALCLFGPVATVCAEVDRRRPGVEVDDDVFLALAHISGVRSHLWMSAIAAQYGPRMRLLGGSAAYTKFGLDVQEEALRRGERPDRPGWGKESPEHWGMLGTPDDVLPVPTEPGAYQRFYAGVATALREGGPPPVDPADSIAALEIIEAAQRSAVEGGIVKSVFSDQLSVVSSPKATDD
jgi:predicted dehydrogenase